MASINFTFTDAETGEELDVSPVEESEIELGDVGWKELFERDIETTQPIGYLAPLSLVKIDDQEYEVVEQYTERRFRIRYKK